MYPRHEEREVQAAIDNTLADLGRRLEYQAFESLQNEMAELDPLLNPRASYEFLGLPKTSEDFLRLPKIS